MTLSRYVAVAAVQATIEPRICEVPGLCTLADRDFLEAEVFPLFDAGEYDQGRAIVSGRRFARCGLSREHVTSEYKWATNFAPEFPAEGPWWAVRESPPVPVCLLDAPVGERARVWGAWGHIGMQSCVLGNCR